MILKELHMLQDEKLILTNSKSKNLLIKVSLYIYNVLFIITLV